MLLFYQVAFPQFPATASKAFEKRIGWPVNPRKDVKSFLYKIGTSISNKASCYRILDRLEKLYVKAVVGDHAG